MMALPMKMKFQGFVGNILIDQHSLAISNAISNKRNKVAMMNSANDINLCLKFSFTLSTARLQTLDSYHRSINQNTFMYIPKTTLA
uniref:Putative ovule protein n=1 Tax=Solanum chacoense TaxID=4108 RepID=A0A0V0GKA6_SOLCH